MELAPLLVGLTGGIGSGKSTAFAVFQRLGAYCVDADHIASTTTQKGNAGYMAVVANFGQRNILTSDGELDRAKLRNIVFQDGTAKATLESILHPIIIASITDEIQKGKLTKIPVILIDIPLLVETMHWRKTLDKVIVVDCSHETQIQRVMERSNLSRMEIERIIANQATRSARLEMADIVINNDADLSAFEKKVTEVAQSLGLPSI